MAANLPRVNWDDPNVQESVRRGTHVYEATAGKHGQYRPTNPNASPGAITYQFQEYPKMMLKKPRPQRKDFRGKPDQDFLYEEAVKEWDLALTLSIVNSKKEEEAWIAEAAENEQRALAEAKAQAEAEKQRRLAAKEDLLEGFRELAAVAKDVTSERRSQRAS